MPEVKLTPIDKGELKPLVTLAFEGDNELLDTYHTLAPATLEECVNNTFAFIDKNKDFYNEDMSCFKVTVNGIAVGYTITIKNEKMPNELYSFGIKKEFRTWEITSQWMERLQTILGTPYYMILWAKNTRAINFFERNGFVSEERNDLKKLIIKTTN